MFENVNSILEVIQQPISYNDLMNRMINNGYIPIGIIHRDQTVFNKEHNKSFITNIIPVIIYNKFYNA